MKSVTSHPARSSVSQDHGSHVASAGVRLLNSTQAMSLLNVSRTWLYAAARDGRIPSIRLGCTHDGPLRFVEADLLEHIARAREAWRPGATSAQALRRAS